MQRRGECSNGSGQFESQMVSNWQVSVACEGNIWELLSPRESLWGGQGSEGFGPVPG